MSYVRIDPPDGARLLWLAAVAAAFVAGVCVGWFAWRGVESQRLTRYAIDKAYQEAGDGVRR